MSNISGHPANSCNPPLAVYMCICTSGLIGVFIFFQMSSQITTISNHLSSNPNSECVPFNVLQISRKGVACSIYIGRGAASVLVDNAGAGVGT